MHGGPETPGSEKILLVEDEPALAESVRFQLEQEGYGVAVASDGPSALRQFRDWAPDLVLLDLMIPGMPGLEVCRAIRSQSAVPVIIVTAKDTEADKVAGLELGADDYITKPFSMRELLARVRANLRRAAMVPPDDGTLAAGPVVIDAGRHELRVRGAVVPATPKEFELLRLLVENRGRLLTRSALIDEVWGGEFTALPNTLDVHIRRIREKVEEDPNRPRHIVTVRGVGYRFE